MNDLDLIPLIPNCYSVRSLDGATKYGCLHCAGPKDFRALRSSAAPGPSCIDDGTLTFPTQSAAVEYLRTGVRA